MTRFNIAALQEQGMTPEEIQNFIRDKERAMYSGPRGSSAPTTPREVYPTQENQQAYASAGPRPPEPKRTTTESANFQELLDKQNKKDTPAMVQEEDPATLANFQAILQKLQGG